MQLQLKNIGMLKEANITLHPLTVIAGENDKGKSTVGKVIFCIVKAVNRYKEDLNETNEYWLNEKLNELYFLVRSAAQENSNISNALPLLELLHPNHRPKNLDINFIEDIMHGCAAWLKEEKIASKIANQVEALCNNLLEFTEMPENIQQAIENAFNKVFAAEFDASLLLLGSEKGSIKLIENELTLLNLEILADNSVHLLNKVEPIALKDATFIETPLVLNYHDLLVRSQTLLGIDKRTVNQLGIPYTTLHTKDLFDKLLVRSSIFSSTKTMNEDLLKEISKLVDGNISYDSSEKDFVFKRDNQTVSIKNTASGIKTFGLLQILLENNLVDKNTVLIFDEPENHLHPKWQLKLAQVLVAMAKNGIQVLVSSHSPYMIEALKRFSELPESKIETGFYLAEERIIKDKDRLADIFAVLSEPFELFRKMDAEALNSE